MLSRLVISWYGCLRKEEGRKFILLGIIFACTIGVNWLFRTLKDSIFITINGSAFIPHVKWASFLVSIPMVPCYAKLVDLFPRHKLFYLLSLLFGCCSLVFAYFLSHDYYGVHNMQSDPSRLLGWCWYIFAESFGSLMITLYWAFLATITTPDSAKRGYGVIALFGQLGNILGPLIAQSFALTWGTGILTAIGALVIFALIPLLYYFMITTDARELSGIEHEYEHVDAKDRSQVNFAEGLGLMFAQPYLSAIFGIVCLYEIVYAIFDYRFKTFASLLYQGELLTQYLGHCGVMTGLLTFVCLFLGLSNITRWLGLTLSLILSPLIMAALTLFSTSAHITTVMWVMVIANALNYALHQPSKEQLFIPTTFEAKYKTKAWIDIFGFRGSKAVGSGINLATALLGRYFIIFSTCASLGCIGLWFFLALFLGKAHKKAVNQKRIVC